jgi:aldose 1-epimerase
MVFLKNSQLEVAVSPNHGAIVNVWDRDGNAWLWGPDSTETYDPEKGGCFPLCPYSNRVRGGRFSWQGENFEIDNSGRSQAHALHGDGWISKWQVNEVSKQAVILSHRGHYSPFNYQASQEISLSEDRLQMVLSITHLGHTPIPYGLGFHPWFPRDADTCLWAPAKEVWEEDAEHLPTRLTGIPEIWNFSRRDSVFPDGWINNLFKGWRSDENNCHKASLDYPSRSARIEIETCAKLDRYILYTNGRPFLCFEPVSHDVDAHNSHDLGGLTVLNQGETMSAEMGITFNFCHQDNS